VCERVCEHPERHGIRSHTYAGLQTSTMRKGEKCTISSNAPMLIKRESTVHHRAEASDVMKQVGWLCTLWVLLLPSDLRGNVFDHVCTMRQPNIFHRHGGDGNLIGGRVHG
jgi:hypothetical protein